MDRGKMPEPQAIKADAPGRKEATAMPAESAAEARTAGRAKLPRGQKPTIKGAPSLPREPKKNLSAIPMPQVRKAPVSEPIWQARTRQDGDIPTAGQTERQKPASPNDTGAPSRHHNKAASSAKGRFSWPMQGKVANRFGHQPNGMYYNHIRIVAGENSPVIAAAPGTIIFSAPLKAFGETIIVKHDHHFATVYTHLGSRLVKVDHHVRKGEQIGFAGKSETKREGYIHFEIRDHHESRNPLLFLP